MKDETTNKATDMAAFNLAASVLRDAGFKQVLILATRLGSAYDVEEIDKSDPKEVKKCGLRGFQSMDTITMLASVGAHIERLMKEHPEEKGRVASFLVRLAEDFMNDDEDMNLLN